MKLHCHPASTTCRPIMLLAAEDAIPLEMEVVDLFVGEQHSERFAAISPNRAVSVLDDGEFRLTECSAILKYLAERTGSAAYPSAARRQIWRTTWAQPTRRSASSWSSISRHGRA